jgi:hypothetical protein
MIYLLWRLDSYEDTVTKLNPYEAYRLAGGSAEEAATQFLRTPGIAYPDRVVLMELNVGTDIYKVYVYQVIPQSLPFTLSKVNW